MLGDPQGRAHCPDGVYFKWPLLMDVCEQTYCEHMFVIALFWLQINLHAQFSMAMADMD